MRLCRFKQADGHVGWGLYTSDTILSLDQHVAQIFPGRLGNELARSWEAALPIGGQTWTELWKVMTDIAQSDQLPSGCQRLSVEHVKLLPPLASPPALLLLAGNYAEHVREQGGTAAEKAATFPYVFMKPPATTLVGSGTPFAIPACAPEKLDHEVELGVIIGQHLRDATIDQAQAGIVGYTVINDISNRGFRPNPQRQTRPRDTFFDWQHGKWHDGSCPCGPCMITADEIPDPHQLRLTLAIDGDLRQDGSTSQMIFSVYELIAFISSFMTLSPGDIISTGTPAGVGNATGKFLAPGMTMVASIPEIGDVVTPVVASPNAK